MVSKVHEHGLAAHQHQIQVEEMFVALLGQGISIQEKTLLKETI
jgi:hypothetical protein